MKRHSKVILTVILCLAALLAGLHLGKLSHEPMVPLNIVENYPQMFADRVIKVSGLVDSNTVALGSWLKVYWLRDPQNGHRLPVSTERSIMPPANMPLTIRVKLKDAIVTPWGRQLLLIEQKPLLAWPFSGN